MESLDATSCFMDDLLDFASDFGEDDDDEDLTKQPTKPFSLQPPFLPLPEFTEEEEELEWISNKDAFPTLETFTGMSTLPKHNSPVSVLEPTTARGGIMVTNYCGSLRVPVKKARSKCLRRRRREIPAQQCWWSEENMKVTRPKIGRKCQHCGSEKTPQWRAGPMGPKTLCNACGVRFKSGRLVPEYRPASSPSFRSELHSNSHRKVMEMRKQKQMSGLVVVKPMEKG